MKKQKITDERILVQKRKIGSDAFQIVFLGLLASILIQQFVLKAEFSQYAVEFILLITGSFYVIIRNLMIGIDIFDSAIYGQKLVVINSLVCGAAVAITTAVLNKKLFVLGVPNGLIALFINFLCATFAAFILLELVYGLNKKKQKKIEALLDEDEDI